MIILGLTGGIASGKSKVSNFLKEMGAKIIDADLIARDIVKPGEKAWAEIIATFGEQFLSADKSIDRKKLGALVFADQGALSKLNEITHPKIISRTQKLLAQFRQSKEKVAVLDAALLVETGMQKLVDQVWVIHVEPEVQLQRLKKRDKINQEQALKRINSQTNPEERLKWANLILENNGTEEELEAKVIKAWKELTSD